MRCTRKGFGNVEKTGVTSFTSLMQFHNSISWLAARWCNPYDYPLECQTVLYLRVVVWHPK